MTVRERGGAFRWPGDPASLTTEGVDFEAVAHVLANTCCWGGRTKRFYSLAQHALTVSGAVGRLGGMNETDTRVLCLHALLADAWRAWFGAGTGIGIVAEKNQRNLAAVRSTSAVRSTLMEAAGLKPDLPGEWAEALLLVRRMAEAAEVRDLAEAGIERGNAGPLFQPLRERIRPLAPDKAAKRWLERFRELSGATAPASPAPTSGDGE